MRQFARQHGMRVVRVLSALVGFPLALGNCAGTGIAPRVQLVAMVPGHAAAGARLRMDSVTCASGAAAADATVAHGVTTAESERASHRWPVQAHKILTVRIGDPSSLAGWTDDNRREVISALSAWEGVGSPVSFAVVTGESNAAADVKVHWVEKFDSRYEGWTTVSWNHSGWLVNGDVTLALRSPTGQLLTSGERAQVAMHEIGHVLGLSHSGSATSIMRPTVKVTAIAAEDVDALKALYARPSDSQLSLSTSQRAGILADRCRPEKL